MNLKCILLQNGGSNYSEKVKEKIKKEFFPAGVDFTTDLHSMGQYIQEGRRSLFETVISIKTPNSDITINPDDDNLDGLNYLAEKD